MERPVLDYSHIDELLENIDLIDNPEELHRSVEEALRSEIAFLQAQINPHFLYNAINTISAFSIDDSKMTRDLLANLSKYFRGSFDFKNRDKLVTLRKELELMEAYLFIEKARFGKRLQIVYDIDDNVDCMLPPLIIQPLVENSVQHGLDGRKHGGTVRIAVHSEKSSIVISVEDDGVEISESTYGKLLSDEESNSAALKNINQRLISIYGHGLEIERRVGRGTKMTIRIPMENKDILEQSIMTAKENKKKICVLFIDLDGFKEINDKYGHDKGDVVLATVAKRFSEAIRSSDTVSRIGGDEFVMVLQDITSIAEIKEICRRIITLVGKPILLDEEETEVAVTTSIGISISPYDGETAEELIGNADKAMYIAKRNGKNQFVFYSEK